MLVTKGRLRGGGKEGLVEKRRLLTGMLGWVREAAGCTYFILLSGTH